ncbi:tyrosine-type recombinase/integrase, partial [Streptomyces mirabilis]|uniref:tyrosine-type recombinase/integrase n=1 Tax=Streptomyces mirabilis TaxID=68239 RepID=UPI0036D0C84B
MTSLHKAVETFLLDYPEADTTEESYALTLRRCAKTLGKDRPATAPTGEDWHDVLIELWGRKSSNTWNRNRAAVKTFLGWLGDADVATVKLPALCRARKVVIDETKAVDPEELEHLWDPDAVGLRERALWRLLYESSSRAEAVLALNVEDVDLRRRKARAVIKGGRTIWVYFERRGSELLREYIGDRAQGPLFLTNRRPRDWRT